MTEYPSVQRAILAYSKAQHGTKRAKERRLVKARLATMKREIMAARSAQSAPPPIVRGPVR